MIQYSIPREQLEDSFLMDLHPDAVRLAIIAGKFILDYDIDCYIVFIDDSAIKSLAALIEILECRL